MIIEENGALYPIEIKKKDMPTINDAIVLTDRYDYAMNDVYLDFIQNSATNLMYAGQSMGILKPFYTVISSTNDINIKNYNHNINISFSSYSDWQYKEVQLTFGPEDYVNISFKFPKSGYRTIQTFCDLDTIMYLYSEDEGQALCGYDDDSGFSLNAELSYYFKANISYRLFVRLYNRSNIGNVRVAFIPSSNSNYDKITKIKRTEGFWTSEYKDVLVENAENCVSLFTFVPPLEKSFTLETTKKDVSQDTKIYFIDPRRGDNHYADDIEKQLPSLIEDDDSGEGLNAKLSLNRHATSVPFLILASTYNSGVAGKFNLKISGLNSNIFDNIL